MCPIWLTNLKNLLKHPKNESNAIVKVISPASKSHQLCTRNAVSLAIEVSLWCHRVVRWLSCYIDTSSNLISVLPSDHSSLPDLYHSTHPSPLHTLTDGTTSVWTSSPSYGRSWRHHQKISIPYQNTGSRDLVSTQGLTWRGGGSMLMRSLSLPRIGKIGSTLIW